MLGRNGLSAEDWVVGKAEHLKVLMVEWMRRVDGPNRVYSNPRWDLNQGLGAIREVQLRRTWRNVSLWVSDRVLNFGSLVLVGDRFVRNEYLYVGRTRDGELNITDVEIEPYANKTYVVFADGKRFDGATAGDGGIDLEIPKSATQVDITCWVDEYPTGRQKTWSVSVEELPPSTELRGAMLRLHNLGYFSGAIGETAGPNEKAALRWFQKEHDLEPTGNLDAETASELERVHGS